MKYRAIFNCKLLSNSEYLFEADGDREAVKHYIEEFGETPRRLEVYDEAVGMYVLAFEVAEDETQWGTEEHDWFPREVL